MRATTICAVHTAGTGSLADEFVSVMLHIQCHDDLYKTGSELYLLAGAAHEGALELLEGAADLVAEGGVALLVNHWPATAEEAAAAGGCCCCGCVTMCHFVW